MMGSPKNSCKIKRSGRKSSNVDFSDISRNFKALFSVIQSPEGMKLPVLKNLYQFLLHLSSVAQWNATYAVGSHDFGVEICLDGIEVAFRDICELSNVLFKKLDERFEQLFLKFCEISADKDLGESSSCSGLLNAFEVANLLFRCCLLLLTLLDPEQNLVLEKGRILFRIVRRLRLPDVVENTRKHAFVFEKSVLCEGELSYDGCATSSVEDFTASLQFLEPHNPLYFFMSTMLEVFVDELLVHGQLRGYFKIINSVASNNEMLFSPRLAQGDIAIVMEAICNHFILSFSNKQAFGDFLDRLFCVHAKEFKYPFRAPAIGVTTAVSLLLSPIMVSAPKYVQAHLISLVSEAIDIKSLKPDRKLINYFLSTFEKSIILYMRNTSFLKSDVYSTSMKDYTSSSSHDIAYSPFEFYLLPETRTKIDSLTTKLDKSNLNLNDCILRMKSDLVSSSMRYVKECQNVYGISCQDEVLAILSCLVLKASESCEDKAPREIEVTTLRHIYLLASLLKLVSISLLQAIRCLTHADDRCCLKILKDFSSCKEYDFILGIITCFRDVDVSLPLQKVLSGVMSNHSTRHTDSKMMFLHFLGLMSLSFASGLDCLVKASLLTILALLNLFVFEEGSLDALQSFVDSNRGSFSSGLPVVRFQETVVDQNTSLVVASKFQKMRSLYSRESTCNETGALSSQTLASESQLDDIEGIEEETEETSNGEVFLRCMLRMGGEVPDFDDLASFVECKQGKDYSAWLKNRKKYRRWRSEKMAVLRWKRKKKTWKTSKVKGN